MYTLDTDRIPLVPTARQNVVDTHDAALSWSEICVVARTVPLNVSAWYLNGRSLLRIDVISTEAQNDVDTHDTEVTAGLNLPSLRHHHYTVTIELTGPR